MEKFNVHLTITYKSIPVTVWVAWNAGADTNVRFLCTQKLPRACPVCGSKALLEETYDEYANKIEYEKTTCWCCPYNQQHNRPLMPLILKDEELPAFTEMLCAAIIGDWEESHIDESTDESYDNRGNWRELSLLTIDETKKGLDDSRQCTRHEALAMYKEWQTLTGKPFPIQG